MFKFKIPKFFKKPKLSFGFGIFNKIKEKFNIRKQAKKLVKDMLRGGGIFKPPNVPKVKKLLTDEQKLYRNLTRKYKNRLNKLDKYETVMREISHIGDFTELQFYTEFLHGLPRRLDFIKLQHIDESEISEKIKIMQADIDKFDEVFKEIGSISGDVESGFLYSQKFKETMTMVIAKNLWHNSKSEEYIQNEDDALEKMEKYGKHFGLSPKKTWKIFKEASLKNNGGESEYMPTLERYLKYMEVV